MIGGPVGPACAGLLLTGGASRRFGSPKAALRLGGESLAQRSARVLAEVAEPVLEVGPGWSGRPAVSEAPPGRGPLVALVAGADALAAVGARGPVLVLAVDLPFVEPALLRFLAGRPPAAAVVPRVAGRAQPLCARFAPDALDTARLLVARGARALRELLGALATGVDWLDESDWEPVASARAFSDVDTAADARRAGLEVPG